MSTMSGEMRRRPPAAILLGRLAAVATLVCFVSGAAVAQTAPPATPAPANAPAPSLESGDTAPPPGAPPVVTPLPPAAAPAQTAVVEPLYVPPPQAPQQLPLYRRNWFWGAIGLVLVTGVVILFVSLSNQDPTTPGTRLGDMRAF